MYARLLAFLFVSLSLARISLAQCESWSALGSPDNGTNLGISTLCVFDDGTGAALYAGGGFTSAGGVPASRIARWNGTSWSALGSPGSGTNDFVNALCVFDDGSGAALYAGGNFTIAGGVLVGHIAKWDGTSWSTLGTGMHAPVYALTVFDDGTGEALYAGGAFNTAGDVAAYHIAGLTGRGCNNSASTGGAKLIFSGTTSPDTLVLTQQNELSTAASICLQGSSQLISPAFFGDGLRCVGGTLLRLYTKTASFGTVTAPQAGDLSITAQSAQLGDAIAPGSTRHYQVYDRDPQLSFCPSPPGDGFNVGNALRVVW